MNSLDFNVPQNRERIFVVSIRNDIKKDFKFPEEKDSGLRLKDILEDNVDEKFYLRDDKVKEFIEEYKGNKIIITLGGFTTKEYTLNQPPKPLLGFFEVDVTCDEEKGKLSVIDLQNTISIEPVGFSMNLGYVVEK